MISEKVTFADNDAGPLWHMWMGTRESERGLFEALRGEEGREGPGVESRARRWRRWRRLCLGWVPANKLNSNVVKMARRPVLPFSRSHVAPESHGLTGSESKRLRPWALFPKRPSLESTGLRLP